MKIVCLVENTSNDDRLIAEHGLSLWIEFEDKYYLLDAGQSAAFMNNAKVLNVDLNRADYCLLSHAHYDHGDGFYDYLNCFKNKKVIAHSSIFKPYYSKSRGCLHEVGLNKELFELKDHFQLIKSNQTICKHVYGVFVSNVNSGYHASKAKLYNENMELDDFGHELTLVFELESGVVVLNSCSHGGVVEIISEVEKIFNGKKVTHYIGGLHMKEGKGLDEKCRYNDEEIRLIVSKIKDVDVYTGHCTGDVSYQILKNHCSDKLHPLHCGEVIVIK